MTKTPEVIVTEETTTRTTTIYSWNCPGCGNPMTGHWNPVGSLSHSLLCYECREKKKDEDRAALFATWASPYNLIGAELIGGRESDYDCNYMVLIFMTKQGDIVKVKLDSNSWDDDRQIFATVIDLGQ